MTLRAEPGTVTAPTLPLVEKVARAVAASIYRSEGLETMNYGGVDDYCHKEWRHYEDEAQAAIAACRAGELLAALRQMRKEYGIILTVSGQTLVDIDKLLAELDDQPSEGV